MATASRRNVMTLGTQHSKTMASLVQPNGNPSGCVIVNPQSSTHSHNAQKTVLINLKRPAASSAEQRGSVLTSSMSTGASNCASEAVRCKRRISFAHAAHAAHMSYAGMPTHQPASVARRNARERNRVKQVNNGFATLRSHIPLSVAAALASPSPPPSTSSSSSRGNNASKKLSKVDTLRMAVEYIRSLKQLLEEHENDSGSMTGSSGDTVRGNDYYSSSPESSSVTVLTAVPTQYGHHNMGSQSNPLASLSPPCSEASSSPTPSYTSEGSGSAVSSYQTANAYQQENSENYENYENYEPMSPEDEELLDVISWWQQSQ